MCANKKSILLLFLMSCALFLAPVRGVIAQEKVASTIEQPTEIESVIKILESSVAREELVRQLKIMAQAQQQTEPESQIKTAASQALQDISRRLNIMSESVMALAGSINQIPQISSWFKAELTDPQSRQLWTQTLINLTLTLGLGYLAFYLFHWGLNKFRRSVTEKPIENCLFRAVRLLWIFFIDCLPILAFAIASYLTIGIVGSHQEKTRLVALAWINAFIIAQGIQTLCNILFSPSSPNLRCSDLSDETANYLVIWSKRLSFTAVYGYFTLQAALFLGLPPLSYDILSRLLGLLVTVLIVILIMQNRERVSSHFQQWSTAGISPKDEIPSKPHGIRNRLAQSWHLLTIVYIVLLYGVWALQIEGGFFYLMRATILTMVALFITQIIIRLLYAVFTRGFQISEELKIRFPDLEKRANRYTNTLHRTLNFMAYSLGLMSILQAWGINTFSWLISSPGKALSGTIIAVSGILLVALLIWEITNSLIESYLNRTNESGIEQTSARTRTLLAVARKALTITLTVVATLMVLSELGVDIAPLLAGAGVLGLAIGFGAQKLVQDVITGVFILLEDQIAVGDVINVGDKGGLVEAVSIRTVRLRDLSGTVHTIPFSSINIVSNLTKDFSFYVMNVGVAYRENVDEVMQALQDIGAELQKDEEYGQQILEPLEVLGVDAFADSAVVIKARIKTAPIKQWWVGREFNRRMKQRFDELGIEIPFPHTTIYFGENKGGGAAPAIVQVESKSRIESVTDDT